MLLGGAALTRDYAESDLAKLYQGPLFYCKDAFEGLHTMDRIMAGEAEAVLEEKRAEIDRRTALRLRAEACARPSEDLPDHSDVQRDNPVPTPPFWGRRVVSDIPLKEIFPFINELALFRGQWGFKKGKLSEAEFERLTEEKARPVFKRLQQRGDREEAARAQGRLRLLPLQSEGDDLIVYHPEELRCKQSTVGNQPIAASGCASPSRARQTRRRLCISDFFRSKAVGPVRCAGRAAGHGRPAHQRAARRSCSQANQYQEYLYWHGFGVESAEALAELWHKRMRAGTGLRLRGRPEHPRDLQPGLPRQPLQLRLRRLPEPGGPRQDHGTAPRRRDRPDALARTSCSSPSNPPTPSSSTTRRRSTSMCSGSPSQGIRCSWLSWPARRSYNGVE